MLTQKDLTLLSQTFATKAELRHEISRLEEKMMTREEGNRLYKLVDTVLGEVKAMREEQAVHAYRHDRTDERLDKIEQAVFVSDSKD